jgi:DNA-binding NarL/FixJ family response regulator
LEIEFPQHHVIEVCSGEESVTLAATQPVDVILMDIDLPQINGIEAVRQIKTQQPSTKIVMMTIHDEKPYRDAAREAGADAFVSKRDGVTDLVPVLTTWLADRKSATRHNTTTARTPHVGNQESKTETINAARIKQHP